MRVQKTTTLLTFLFVCVFGNSIGQKNFWTSASEDEIPTTGVRIIEANKYLTFRLDVGSLRRSLSGAAIKSEQHTSEITIALPDPSGKFHEYQVYRNTTMHPKLAEEFPDIISFNAESKTGAGSLVKFDITPQGFHAMIMSPDHSTIFIDPYSHLGDTEHYIVYYRSDFTTSKEFECATEGLVNNMSNDNPYSRSFGTCELRTYRLALSATGEYTTYHGGTVPLAQAAQVTTMNRVNGIYERDMAITMEIIAGNSVLIYTNSATDPFTNGTPGTMIGQNQTNTNTVIGSANYDIGHVFGTNSGGLAGLGVVCTNSTKAKGVTGSSNPINDPFDIDYVAHEMGHQFGCRHTFNNSCSGNRNNGTAMEPGSGSTIMAYAGICSPNVQSNSDDHFHGISLEEIETEIFSHSCPVKTPLVNSAPVLVSTAGNVTIPINTPFALTAVATDADGDPLTYCWEQMDNDITTQAPLATATGGPNFRSLSPMSNPTRYMPSMAALTGGGPFTWEVIPSVARTMDFRVVVRDNAAGGGCNDHGDLVITTDAGSGPFVVNYPSTTAISWAGLTSETVTWSVANTDLAPVSCANVDILLSTNGGTSWDTVATSVANDGSQLITVPNTATTTALIMVICDNGTFFDISNNEFTITAATSDYTLSVVQGIDSVCQPDTGWFTVDVGFVGGYSDPVTLSTTGLPVGLTASFSPNPVTPGNSSILQVTGTGGVSEGSYLFTIDATSTSGPKSVNARIVIASGSVSASNLVAPADLAASVGLPVSFSWTNSGSGIVFDIDIATDAGFVTIVESSTGLTSPAYNATTLLANTTYYWRVFASTACASSVVSTTFQFTTEACYQQYSTNVPISISSSGTPTINSTLAFIPSGVITDINVVDLTGTHTYINDLEIELRSPQGTVVELFARICGGQNNFDLSLDDQAPPGALPCPPIGGGIYQPSGDLSDFIGEDPAGVWTLTIRDVANQDGGALDSWALDICMASCLPSDVPTLAGASPICSGNSTSLSVSAGNLNSAQNWFWYSTSCGTGLIGSGTSVSVSPTSRKTYYARGEGNCVTGGSCDSIIIDVTQNYIVNVNDTICQGDVFTFPDASTGTTTGAQNSVFTAANACDSIIITNLFVLPAISVNRRDTICEGGTYLFPDGSSGGTAGVQTSNLTTADNCDSVVYTNLAVIPLDLSVSASGINLSANMNGAAYQWVDCGKGFGNIAGATSQQFTPAQNGSYAVSITNGDCNGMSTCTEVSTIGLTTNELSGLRIYPNPTSGVVNVDFGKVVAAGEISITDARGRLVAKKTNINVGSQQFDLSAESNGIYFIFLRVGEAMFQHRFSKH